jgi:hypothetical protein
MRSFTFKTRRFWSDVINLYNSLYPQVVDLSDVLEMIPGIKPRLSSSWNLRHKSKKPWRMGHHGFQQHFLY